MPDSIELLTAHHLPYRVVNIIENAEQFVVLVTAYFTSWTDLDHAIRATVARAGRRQEGGRQLDSLSTHHLSCARSQS